MRGRLHSIDIRALDWIYENLRSRKLDPVMRFLSFTGNIGIVWFIAAFLLYVTRVSPEATFCIVLALISSALVANIVLKRVLRRDRPFVSRDDRNTLIAPPSDFSFPSGHTFSSFAAATAILMNAPKLGIIALIYAGGIAFSRLYLYVHYLSDVLFSVLFGVGTGLLVCYLYNINVPL
ncbi:MAG: phosphatase PAP2 family protein [Oscillospiraceae bacterium]|jgi:undecaprenyl-diphosphatase|nr:phosphatase PAP2 family protein [Oscillospiraceae bacterium]